MIEFETADQNIFSRKAQNQVKTLPMTNFITCNLQIFQGLRKAIPKKRKTHSCFTNFLKKFGSNAKKRYKSFSQKFKILRSKSLMKLLPFSDTTIYHAFQCIKKICTQFIQILRVLHIFLWVHTTIFVPVDLILSNVVSV